MKLAVASGKGGTGKTTLAVTLTCSAPDAVHYLDCDVEEPNGHLFLKPVLTIQEPVTMAIPVVDATRCIGCGQCGEICRFNAIVSIRAAPMVFAELCHGCGGCAQVCPTGAITEELREIGTVEMGYSGPIEFTHGRLNVGQAMSPPVIRAVKRHVASDGLSIIDCPPGTSCPVIAAMRGCDFVLLVTEPTPFGLHDLRLAVETVRKLALPFGVAINRSDIGDGRVEDYCQRETIPVLARIPEDRRIAEAGSRGDMLLGARPDFRSEFERIIEQAMEIAERAKT